MNEEFAQGETLIATVSGNFLLPLQEENVVFYRGHVKIPIEYDIKKIDEDYYIYALLVGKESANYSMALEDIRYMKGGEMSEEEIVRNFIINNQTADFSVNPGVVSEAEFSLEVQNLQEEKITIQISTSGEENSSIGIPYESITLKSGQKESIDFLFEEPVSIFKTIELSTGNFTYAILASIPATTIQEETFKFEPQKLVISVSTDSQEQRTVYIYNVGKEDLTNVTISLSDSLVPYTNISQESINNLASDSNAPIELTFFSEEEFELEGHIMAQQEEEIIYLQISVKFLENYVPPEEPIQEYTTETCAELGYPICASNEECSTDNIIYAKDNVCCVGACKPKEKSSAGMIIGIILLVLVVVGSIWFYKKKYKKAKKPINLLKVARGKAHESVVKEKYKNRIKPTENKPITKVVEKPVVKIVERPVIRHVEKKVFVERPREEPKTYKYVGSLNTKKYHKSSCRLSKLIKDEYKEQNDSPEYFQKKGYKPCKVCLKV